jgi:hypothetical protein
MTLACKWIAPLALRRPARAAYAFHLGDAMSGTLEGGVMSSLADGSALPLPRLRGRVGVGVPDRNTAVDETVFPHPPRSIERVDLPRKRER